MLYIIEVKHSQLVRTYKKPYQLVVIMGQTLVSKPAKLGMSELSGSQKLCFLSMDICLIFMVITIGSRQYVISGTFLLGSNYL